MPGNEIHYALDIGSSALKLVRFLPASHPHILSTSAHPLPESITSAKEHIPDGAKECESRSNTQHGAEITSGGRVEYISYLNEQLARFLKDENPRLIKPIWVSMLPSDTFIRYITLPHIPEQKIERIIAFEAEQQIPFSFDEVLWDYALMPAKKGGERDAVLCAIKKEIAGPVVESLRQMRFSVRAIVANHVALLHLYGLMNLDRQDILSIDLGAQSTSLLMMRKQSFWSRSLSQGSEKLIELIVQEKGVDREGTQNLLRRIRLDDTAEPEEKLLQAVAERYFVDLLNEISRTISFYQSIARGVKFQHLLLTGGMSMIPGLPAFFEKNLGIQTSRLALGPEFKVGADVIDGLRKQHPVFSAALGLAAGSVKKMPAPIDMISSEERSARLLSKQRARYYLFGALTVLFLSLFMANVYFERGAKERALRVEEAKVEYYRSVREKEKLVESRLEGLDKRLSLLRREIKNKSRAFDVFKELAARTPESIWFRSFVFDGAESTIRLEGLTYGSLNDINHYADQLAVSALFRTVEVESAGIEEEGKDKKKEEQAVLPETSTGGAAVEGQSAVDAASLVKPPEEKQMASRFFVLRVVLEDAHGQ